jgi:hypothetical protein
MNKNALYWVLNQAFIQLENNNHIKRKILFQKIQTALDNKQTHSLLGFKQFTFPKNWDFSRRLEEACALRIKNPPTPVITGHPTECMSEEVRIEINELIKKVINPENLLLDDFLVHANSILSKSWLPTKPLTPLDEIERQNNLYISMMEEWHEYNKRDIALFLKQYPAESSEQQQEIIYQLTLANKLIFNQVTSWFVGDVDGNTQKSLTTMQLAPKLLQLGIIRKYQNYLEGMAMLIPEVSISIEYLNKIKNHIETIGPLSRQMAIKFTSIFLEKTYLLTAKYPKYKNFIQELQDFLFITHFDGELKQHFRESAIALEKAINNPNLPESKRIFEMLEYVKNHAYNFTCILSDTQSSKQIFALNKLLHNSVEIIPLCETETDLENLPNIIKDIINDFNMRNQIIKRLRFSYLAGPSDLAARAGEFSLIKLLDTENLIQKLLQELSNLFPQLQNVKLKVFYGLGNDSERRLSQAKKQLWSTHQGVDASTLAEPLGFTSFLRNMTGASSENTLRTEELKEFAKKNNKSYLCLKDTIIESSIRYRNYINNNNSIVLMQRLIYPQLSRYLNTSSRAESKLQINKNIASNRAIGQVNHYQLSRLLVRRFIGFNALPQGPIINEWYQELSAFKELTLKSLTAIACTNFPRAWQRIGMSPPTKDELQNWYMDFINNPFADKPHYALAFGQVSAQSILNNLNLNFNNPNLKNIDPNTLPNLNALMYMENHPNPEFSAIAKSIKNNLLPHYDLLEKLLDQFEKDKNNLELIENIVCLLRMDNCINSEPHIIPNIKSPRFYQDVNQINLKNSELQSIYHL